MFKSLLVGAASAAMLIASSAQAEPFENFLTFCMRTNADQNQIIAAATEAGWLSFPAELMGEDQPFEDTKIYLSDDPSEFGDKGPPGDFSMLLFGTTTAETFDIKGARLNACAVGSAEVEADVLWGRLRAMLGFDPIEMGETQGWIFSRSGQDFVSENTTLDAGTEAEVRELARQKKIYVATVSEDSGQAILVLGALKPD